LGTSELPSSEALALREEFPVNLLAAKSYVAGLARLRSFDPLQARDELETAVQNDSRSAVIHAAFAEAWAALGYEARAKAEGEKAFALSIHLSRENKLSVEGRYREFGKDWPRAMEVYHALWTYFPDDVEYGLRLARAQISGGKPVDAQATITQIRKLPSPYRSDPRIDMAEAEAAEDRGDFQQELEAAQRAIMKAGRRGNRWLVARAKLRACWALDNLGQRKKAQELAEEAEKTLV
jgi:tetratricopeptide (TPR) repeat protein